MEMEINKAQTLILGLSYPKKDQRSIAVDPTQTESQRERWIGYLICLIYITIIICDDSWVQKSDSLCVRVILISTSGFSFVSLPFSPPSFLRWPSRSEISLIYRREFHLDSGEIPSFDPPFFLQGYHESRIVSFFLFLFN